MAGVASRLPETKVAEVPEKESCPSFRADRASAARSAAASMRHRPPEIVRGHCQCARDDHDVGEVTIEDIIFNAR